MPNGLIKIVWRTTKWFATLIAFAGAVLALLFLYDLLTHRRWGYPWWLLAILVGTSAIAWFLRREAAWMLKEIIERDAMSSRT